MKSLRSLLTVAVFCLMGSFVSAQEFTYAQEFTPQQILNELVANSKYRPKQVTTLEAFELPLMLDGKPSGTVKVNPGTPLDVVSVKTDGVIVDIHGNQTKLAVNKTDLIARFADRKKEVDKEVEEARQALIAEGHELYVAPLPPVVEGVQVAQNPQVVYVDNSHPIDRVNYGNYWPYTADYYYPYAESYVVVSSPANCYPNNGYPNNYYPNNGYPNNPYYCYQPRPGTPTQLPTAAPTPVARPVNLPAYRGNALFYKPGTTPVVNPRGPARP